MAKKKIESNDDDDDLIPQINPFKSTKDLEDFILTRYDRYTKRVDNRLKMHEQQYNLYLALVKDCRKKGELPPANITEALTSAASKMTSLEISYNKFLADLDKQKNILRSLDDVTTTNENTINIIGFGGFNGTEIRVVQTQLPDALLQALEENEDDN